jgi:hypothetical protein
MKKLLRCFVLSLSVVAVLWCCGCASVHARVPKTSKVVARISQPPPGKALVNFHRPTSFRKLHDVLIFDINGKMLVEMRGNSLFQCVCDPGDTIFIGWADHVTVIKANLAPDKIYDIMVDVTPGAMLTQFNFSPLTKDDPRRAELAEFERREKWTIAANTGSPQVAEYEAGNRERIEQIKKDFLGGPKSDRVIYQRKYDCR